MRLALASLAVFAFGCAAPTQPNPHDGVGGVANPGGDLGSTSTSDGGTTTSGDGGMTSSDGGAASCPSPVAPDSLAAMRQACAFVSGDRADKTLGLDEPTRKALPIEHIVVVMKENRSFDHIYGGLKATQPDVDVADGSFTNLDGTGAPVAPYHLDSTCVGFDPDHQWDAMHAMVDGGKMDGFVKSAATSTGGDGHFVMGHYEATDLPFYYFLADTFAIADHHFPSVRSGTFPNRDYLLLGTSDKVTTTQYTTWPDPTLPTIFDELNQAGVSWGVYGDDHPLEETLDNPAHDWSKLNTWSPVQKLLDDFANDTVPQVVFVDGTENVEDEHPTADLQLGEAWTKKIYDAALASKAWSSTAIVFTYDEAGGFADHVPPSSRACLARPQDSMFFERGPRVPLVVVSPWARRHFVSHVEREHTSITRFIEAVFGLPALTARDANADALFDMFDFGCAPAPIATAPAAGTKGCGGGATITLDKTSFASGETFTIHFSGGPGNSKDWIGIYPRSATVQAGSTLWKYCAGDTHTAGASGVKSGSVTIDATSVNDAASWPLPAGSSWTAYYLVNDGYSAIASVQFDIHN